MSRGLGFSFLLHVVLALLIFFSKPLEPNQKIFGKNRSVEVRTLSPKQLKNEVAKARDELHKDNEKIIVQSDKSLKHEESPENYVSLEKVFLSGQNSIVDKNTRAAKVGTFKNVLKEGVENGAEKIKAKQTHARSEKNITSSNEDGSHSQLKNLLTLTPQAQDLEQQTRLASKTGRTRGPASIEGPATDTKQKFKKGDGESATDDYLEDISIGANTLLNTKEFVFYSFYERIREKIAHTWRNQLSGELDQIFARGDNLAYDRKTKVQVDLDRNGQLKNITIINSSGVTELDRAAVSAFKLAAPFPNPPQGMINTDDNGVSIRWDFVVMAENSGPSVRMEVRRAPANF
jgi:protein TonB